MQPASRRVGLRRTSQQIARFPRGLRHRRTVLISAGQHARRFLVGVVLIAQFLEDAAGAPARSASSEGHASQLAQAHISRRMRDTFGDDVVGDERFAQFQKLFAEPSVDLRKVRPLLGVA
jgi:hypothetical protein